MKGQAEGNAKRILVHYFRTVFVRAGAKFDNDNTAEVEGIVEDLIEAVKDELRKPAPEPAAPSIWNCATCRGEGTIEIDFSTHNHRNQVQRVPCPKCGGGQL